MENLGFRDIVLADDAACDPEPAPGPWPRSNLNNHATRVRDGAEDPDFILCEYSRARRGASPLNRGPFDLKTRNLHGPGLPHQARRERPTWDDADDHAHGLNDCTVKPPVCDLLVRTVADTGHHRPTVDRVRSGC